MVRRLGENIKKVFYVVISATSEKFSSIKVCFSRISPKIGPEKKSCYAIYQAISLSIFFSLTLKGPLNFTLRVFRYFLFIPIEMLPLRKLKYFSFYWAE